MKKRKHFHYYCICEKKIRSDYKKHFKSYYHRKNSSHKLSNKIIDHYKLKYYIMKKNNYILPYDLWNIVADYYLISNKEQNQKLIEHFDKNRFFNKRFEENLKKKIDNVK